MKRKTNLFYSINTDDCNFLTFSNYTEHLTGVFLATNFKIFPSRFLCFNIPSLSSEQKKQEFIEDYLVGYYENKLAMLRDFIVNENSEEAAKNKSNIEHPDDIMVYLGYLIDTIMKFDARSELVFASTITEQDYNGTFTDIICTIDSGVGFNTQYDIIKYDYESRAEIDVTQKQDVDYLYGWTNIDNNGQVRYVGPTNYMHITPKFDSVSSITGSKTYFLESDYKIYTTDIGNNSKDTISFNVIIPLYDITNMDYVTNTTTVEELPNLNMSIADPDSHSFNVPYGIWFANDTITLKRDIGTKYAPSWSLLIGTQFKPFPTSNYLTQDGNNTVSKMAGFATYAQILCRQNKVYDKMLENNNLLINMQNNINEKISYITNIYNELHNTTNLGQLNDLIKELQELRDKLESQDGTITVNAEHNWIYKTR